MGTLELAPRLTADAHHVLFTTLIRRKRSYTQGASAALILASALAFAVHYWPRSLPAYVPKLNQVISQARGEIRVCVPDRELVGELSRFNDGLFADLMFDYYRGRKMLQNSPLLLVSGEESGELLFRILVHLPPDLIEGVTRLAELKAARLTADIRLQWVTHSDLLRYQNETLLHLHLASDEQPAARRLECLGEGELTAYLRRFLRFKSATDPRVRRDNGTAPTPLSILEASLLAADIVTVSRFYEIPVDFMLGIGAMENNYMDVPGDLDNTAWKTRPQSGDIILARARGRVLVRNDSRGVWQITRESLRHAHDLYLKDKRDYALLPPQLRPERVLAINNVEPAVLTTYAGLLLRELLDHFQGDEMRAAGAYNGTVTHPNLRYAAGVQLVAVYARKMIERAADRNRPAETAASLEKGGTAIAALNRGVNPLPK